MSYPWIHQFGSCIWRFGENKNFWSLTLLAFDQLSLHTVWLCKSYYPGMLSRRRGEALEMGKDLAVKKGAQVSNPLWYKSSFCLFKINVWCCSVIRILQMKRRKCHVSFNQWLQIRIHWEWKLEKNWWTGVSHLLVWGPENTDRVHRTSSCLAGPGT